MTPPSPASARSVSSLESKTYSCSLCRQRKVKCDRRSPCSNCRKTDQPCSFVPPVRGKRKRTKIPQETLHGKLERYESLLTSHGVPFHPATPEAAGCVFEEVRQPHDYSAADSPGQTTDITPLRSERKTIGKLVSCNGFSRYYDSPLWSNLGNGLQHPEAGDQTDRLVNEPNVDDGGAFFESEDEQPPSALTSLHFPHSALPKLRLLFIDRVDSLAKILHFPSFWATLVPGLQQPQTLGKSFEALIFCFYLSVIITLSEEECQDLLQVNKADALRRYRSAARQALMNARFLSTSNMTTLQAFSLFLICVRNVYSSDTLHVLSGIAIRLARKMGLHRDGAALGLAPFETEMRRRLWWHLAHIDFRIADVLGIRASLDLCSGDTKIPCNVSDDKLDPTMAVAPEEEQGITPVTLCLIRCEIMDVLAQFSPSITDALGWETLNDPHLPLAKRDEIIDQVEDRLERKYLRYCDPADNLHTCVSIVIRSSICKMKLFAHNPRSLTSGNTSSDEERDIVFTNAIKLLGYAPLMRGAMPGLNKYRWQIGTSYIWNTVLYVLIEVRRRKTGPEVERMWPLLGQIFKYYPRVSENMSGATVYAAISRWTREAWHEHVVAMENQGLDVAMPEYIKELQDQDLGPHESLRGGLGSSRGSETRPNAIIDQEGTALHARFEDTENAHHFPNLLTFETDPNEWLQWEQLLADHGDYS